jgi:tight adherence protein B
MGAFLISAAAAVLVFIAFLILMTKRISNEGDRRRKSALNQASADIGRFHLPAEEEVSLFKQQSLLPANSILAKIPGIPATFSMIQKTGLGDKVGVFFLSLLLLAFITFFMTKSMGGLIALPLSIVVPILLGRFYLKGRIQKRNDKFIEQFPDAVDMIVRSVRSGHPLNSAMRMISENTESPIRDEFKQVVDEVAYGRTVPEALLRMSHRIDEQDLHFFVVVLSVHQETGGSLAEVLSNLSGIIRKRKQLRLKIRALTSEGRATSYILGALPVVEFGMLMWISPKYIDPLLHTPTGLIISSIALTLIIAAVWIVRVMVNIDI